MPEGDTIRQIASVLGPRLEGRTLAAARLRDVPELELAGRRVESVRARGKHLFVGLDGGLLLRSHLGMHGSWHVYAPGEPWKKAERRAAIVLATDDDVFVCFDAKEVEALRAGGLRARDIERRLGPDLADADAEIDFDALVGRARERLAADAPLVDVLLDQRVAAGAGNVYNSEMLFVERLHPLARLADVDDERLRALFESASRALRANLGGGPRVTRDAKDRAGEKWVYGRAGRPCLRCGAMIETRRLGRGRRDTYWCPACQRLA